MHADINGCNILGLSVAAFPLQYVQLILEFLIVVNFTACNYSAVSKQVKTNSWTDQNLINCLFQGQPL